MNLRESQDHFNLQNYWQRGKQYLIQFEFSGDPKCC